MNLPSLAGFLLPCGLMLACGSAVSAEPPSAPRASARPVEPAAPAVSVSPAERNTAGELVHVVRSPYQSRPVRLRVLLPAGVLPAGETRQARLPVVYVLPVEPGSEQRYGDGLAEIRRSGLDRRHRAIWVAPEFSQLPWYADHPTNRGIRQEEHLLQAVLPFIEKQYPARA
ncbi:MAG: hypothetical protein KDA79_17785, partial [Planctomycetaceae bacterium]|nr:hypothetical protein [Planctomycetaceae bacterium]